MIGKLSGRIDYKMQDHLLLDVRGVGYVVYCAERTLATLPAPGEAVALYTDLVVREDLLQLFGFPTLVEKEWHRLLTSVQGVGAKASLAILSALGPDGVGRAIALGDWNAIKAAKGVGPKIAQRVVAELKDKAPMVMAMGQGSAAELIEPVEPAATPAAAAAEPAARKTPAPKPAANVQGDALSALANLGYQPSEAAQAVAQALTDDPGLDMSGLIRAALRQLAPKD